MTGTSDSRRLMRLIASVFFLLAASALAAMAAPIGEVVAIGGFPEASGPGGDRALGPGSALFEGDRVVTGYGNAQIIFVDETRMVVGPNSTLVIDRFLLRGNKRATKISLDALRGTYRFISGRSNKEAYEIKTGNATIGIRGTAFDFSSKMTTVVATFAGYVSLSSGDEEVTSGPNCDVTRAAFGNVGAYDGRAAGVLITNNLPYVLDQSSLAAPFRLDVSDCDSKVNVVEKGRRFNDRDSRGGGDNNGGGGGNGGSGGGNGGNGGGNGGGVDTDSPSGGDPDPPAGGGDPPGRPDPDPDPGPGPSNGGAGPDGDGGPTDGGGTVGTIN